MYSFAGSGLDSSTSPVAIRMTWTALPITSAGRRSPFGPRGMLSGSYRAMRRPGKAQPFVGRTVADRLAHLGAEGDWAPQLAARSICRLTRGERPPGGDGPAGRDGSG